jgi:hypothetical protein
LKEGFGLSLKEEADHWLVRHIGSMSLGRRILEEWISRVARARTDKLHVLLFGASAIKIIFYCQFIY